MTVSVVIPALNEAVALPATLASVTAQAAPSEVVVVDGDSTDETVAVAERFGARVIRSARGRAHQMNAGAAATSGEVLLFLHADTHLPEHAFRHVRAALRAGADAGCFRLRFDADTPALRLWTHPIWMRWPRLAFGDRALFCFRRAFEAADGFPDQPIFEDLDLVQRLVANGRFAMLDEAVTTSARRFLEGGTVRQQARNTALWTAWNLGISPERLARFYGYGPPPSDPRSGPGVHLE